MVVISDMYQLNRPTGRRVLVEEVMENAALDLLVCHARSTGRICFGTALLIL